MKLHLHDMRLEIFGTSAALMTAASVSRESRGVYVTEIEPLSDDPKAVEAAREKRDRKAAKRVRDEARRREGRQKAGTSCSPPVCICGPEDVCSVCREPKASDRRVPAMKVTHDSRGVYVVDFRGEKET